MDKALEIKVSSDGSVAGQFEAYLQEFCTDRAQALNRDEILTRRPWTEEGKTWFRLEGPSGLSHSQQVHPLQRGTACRTPS